MTVAWLIECGTNPVLYYCGEGDWCSNPNHALKFPTKKAAELRSMGFQNKDLFRVAEHEWSQPGCPIQSA